MDWFLIAAALLVTFSNGANDNFKGFATVWGSDTMTYRRALALATAATIAGSLTSLALAESLVQGFSGRGLVPDAVANAPLFIAAVASGAAVTVFLATRLGFPVSTTHALIGGLVGGGLAQSAGTIHFDKLANAFLLPLLVSPVLAVILGLLAHRLFRIRPAVKDCACLVESTMVPVPAADGTLVGRLSPPRVVLARQDACEQLHAPVRISVSRAMDRLHVLSAMSICFARGVNDTPKLTALLVATHLLRPSFAIIVVSAVMATGGLLFARQVAHTMSRRVARMDHTQGLAANLITASLVLFASKLGLPVSTTHVSVGSIAGVGASAKTLDWPALRGVLLSWVGTLPLAAAVAWMVASSARAMR